VISTSSRAGDDLQTQILTMCGGNDDALKLIGTQHAGARASDKNAAGLDEFEHESIEVAILVVPQSILVFAVNELRRVGEHDIPLTTVFNHRAHPRKGIGMSKLDSRLVDVRIAFRHFHGLFIEIDGCDFLGASERCIDGKTASVAAEIEHILALAEGGKALAVVALIAEKSGFVRFGKIDFEGDAVLADFQRADALVQRVSADGQLLNARDFGIALNAHAAGAKDFMEQRDPDIEPLPDGEGGDFDR